MSSVSSASPVWLITGASSGIGLALARHVLAEGERVVAAARRIDQLVQALGAPSPQLLPLQLDVTESAQVRRALPLLRPRGGRIVNVSSVGGAHAFPSMGVYAASKAALELYSEALDQEVRGLGVPVIVVEPGPYATEFGG